MMSHKTIAVIWSRLHGRRRYRDTYGIRWPPHGINIFVSGQKAIAIQAKAPLMPTYPVPIINTGLWEGGFPAFELRNSVNKW